MIFSQLIYIRLLIFITGSIFLSACSMVSLKSEFTLHEDYLYNKSDIAKKKQTTSPDVKIINASEEEMYKKGYASMGSVNYSTKERECIWGGITNISKAGESSRLYDENIVPCQDETEKKLVDFDHLPSLMNEIKKYHPDAMTIDGERNSKFWYAHQTSGKCLETDVELKVEGVSWSNPEAKFVSTSTCKKYEMALATTLYISTRGMLWKRDRDLAKAQLDRYHLKQAINNDDLKTTKRLIAKGTNPFKKMPSYLKSILKGKKLLIDSDFEQALIWSIERYNVKTARYLLKLGMPIDKRKKNSDTPLIVATKSGSFDMVKLLLKNGAETNLLAKDKLTAYELALKSAYESKDKELKRKYQKIAQIIKKYGGTYSPFIAIQGARQPELYKDVVKLIEEKNITVNTIWLEEGESVLMAASKGANVDLVKYLLRNGVDVNYTSKRGNALSYAADPMFDKPPTKEKMDEYAQKRKTIIHLLLKKGIDVNVVEGYNKHTPLYISLTNFVYGRNDPESIELLLKYGANVNAQTRKGLTPLMKTVNHRSIDAINLLLKYKADLNIKDKKGETALAKAINSGNRDDVVKLLKSAGAMK